MSRIECFCAFCKTPRKVYMKKRISLFNVLGAVFTSIVMMLLFWRTFDPRVMFIFVVMLAIAEVFVQIRWRLNIVCRECGFDPALYVKNQDLAAEKVRLHLVKRKDDPLALFKPSLNLPNSPSKASKSKVGRLLSKQI